MPAAVTMPDLRRLSSTYACQDMVLRWLLRDERRGIARVNLLGVPRPVWCDGEAKTRGERSRVRERLAGGEMCPLPQLPQRCTPHGLRGDNAAVGAAR